MRIKGKQLEDTLRTADNPFEAIHASQFVGAMDGSLRFKCKNAETTALSKGQAVYISGVSGDVPEVKLADADGAGTVPAIGLTESAANASAEVFVVSFGNLTGLDTASLNTTNPVESIVGRSVFIGTTPGQITIDKPAGSSAKLQNIGQIVREHSSAGIIKVGGAGRTAATPNLDEGKFFIGDTDNKSSESVYTLPVGDGSAGQVLTTDGAGAVTFSDVGGGMTVETITLADTTHAGDDIYDFNANSVDTFYIVETEADKIFRASVIVTDQTLTVGQRIKIYNKGGGTLRLYENSLNSGPNLDPTTSSGTYNAERDINSTALVELIATGTYKWEYVIIPQLELDESTLTQTGEVFAYNATELAMRALPYTFPSSDGTANQILQTSGNGALSFGDVPKATGLQYTDLTANVTIAGESDILNYRLAHESGATNKTITLPLVTTGFISGFYYPITWLNGAVMEIVNESQADLFLKITDARASSSKNNGRTRLYTSAGLQTPYDGAYTYTIGPASRIYLSARYTVESGSASTADLDYIVVE